MPMIGSRELHGDAGAIIAHELAAAHIDARYRQPPAQLLARRTAVDKIFLPFSLATCSFL